MSYLFFYCRLCVCLLCRSGTPLIECMSCAWARLCVCVCVSPIDAQAHSLHSPFGATKSLSEVFSAFTHAARRMQNTRQSPINFKAKRFCGQSLFARAVLFVRSHLDQVCCYLIYDPSIVPHQLSDLTVNRTETVLLLLLSLNLSIGWHLIAFNPKHERAERHHRPKLEMEMVRCRTKKCGSHAVARNWRWEVLVAPSVSTCIHA